jgi:DNA polymerase I-like protein with 3'-5' exonuclease and polymerase domains/uracil-DNA glycosylase
MRTPFRPVGPLDAKIVIVGEALGEQEEFAGQPFVGTSGNELTKMLAEAGIRRDDCYITNVLWERPPDNDLDYYFAVNKTEEKALIKQGWSVINSKCCAPALQTALWRLDAELSQLRPNVTIALGNVPLWALTGKWGITDWRGSEMETREYGKILPTYHPAGILRQWDWRAAAVHDLRRAKRESGYPDVRRPYWSFVVRPSLDAVLAALSRIYQQLDGGERVRLSVDIETRAGHIACVGLAWNRLEAICIPFMCVERPEGYWSVAEETHIIWLLHQILKHPKAFIIGQNHSYDLQYQRNEYLLDYPVSFDCMIAQAICFPGTPKALDYQASMYNEHYCYWKEDGKEWHPSMPEEQLWQYNCEDCVRTFECYEVLDNLISSFDLRQQFEFYMHRVYPRFLSMMYRGVKVNTQTQANLALEILDHMAVREQAFIDLLGRPLNPRSPIQMKEVFIEQLGQKVRFNRKTKRASLDDDALEDIATKEPILRPLVDAVSEYRTLGIFLATGARMRLDTDLRARSDYNVVGAETFRAASRKNPFGRGGNLQNVSSGNRVSSMKMPNMRTMFVPDKGNVLGEADLAGADAQVVAWEADDPILKQMFREKLKLHVENAKMMYGSLAGPDGKREPYYTNIKQGVHATNYLCSPRTLAATINVTVHEAERFQSRWFQIHPWILNWQDKVKNEMFTRRMVYNRFGYRRYYFDRIESVMAEAVAWIPQSTVAICCNTALCNVADNLPEVEVLMQVHDSFVFQAPVTRWQTLKRQMPPFLQVVIPYDDPLIIPFGLKTSTTNWGDATEEKWEVDSFRTG